MSVRVAKLKAIHPVLIIVVIGAAAYFAAGLFIGNTAAVAKASDGSASPSASRAKERSFSESLPSTIPAQIPQTFFAPAPVAGAANSGFSSAAGGQAGDTNKGFHRSEPPAPAGPEASNREEHHSRPMQALPPHAAASQAAHAAVAPHYAQQQQPARPQIMIIPRPSPFGGFGFGGGSHFGGGGHHR